jgi:hypothetical protein
MKQITKAIKLLGTPSSDGKSVMTVDVASTMEKAESIPSKNKVLPRRNAQRLDHCIKSTAVGYAMNASPMEAVFDFARLFLDSKNPTTAQTANPDTKLTQLFDREMIRLSMMIGFS